MIKRQNFDVGSVIYPIIYESAPFILQKSKEMLTTYQYMLKIDFVVRCKSFSSIVEVVHQESRQLCICIMHLE